MERLIVRLNGWIAEWLDDKMTEWLDGILFVQVAFQMFVNVFCHSSHVQRNGTTQHRQCTAPLTMVLVLASP